MRIAQLLFVIALCSLGSGCRLFQNAWQTTIAEPIHYSRNVYDKWAHRHFRGLAACALDEATSVARAELDDYYCEPFSVDYQLGFVDGFVDFLEAGGTGNPTPLPPRRYWKAKYQNPVGYQCTQDWFRGFQHGANAARASNYRSFVTVPLSDYPIGDTTPYSSGRIVEIEQTEETDEGDYAVHGSDPLPKTATRTSKDSPRLSQLPDTARINQLKDTSLAPLPLPISTQ